MREEKAGARKRERWDCTYDVLVGDNVDAELDLSKLAVADGVHDPIRVEHAPFRMG